MTQQFNPMMNPAMATTMAAPTAATMAPTMAAPAQVAPASNEVQQVALPTDFNLMAFATHKEKAESSSARKPAWECTAEELRERVTFRDVQAPSNRNHAEYHLRPFLSPKSLPLEEVLGNDANGNPINTIIVPAEYAEGAKEQFLAQVVKPGYMDALLLRVAQEIKEAKEERDAAPKKAPVDTAAADAALSDLEAMNAQAMPVGVPAGVPTNVPAMEQVAQPVQQVAQPMGVPAGVPAGVPQGVPAMPAGAPAGTVPAQQAMPQMPAGMGVPNFG